MKKIYIAPAIDVVKVNATSMICDSMKFGSTKVTKMESKGRGDYEPADEQTFGDLW